MRGMLFYKGTDDEADEMASFIITLLLAIDIAGGMIGKVFLITNRMSLAASPNRGAVFYVEISITHLDKTYQKISC